MSNKTPPGKGGGSSCGHSYKLRVLYFHARECFGVFNLVFGQAAFEKFYGFILGDRFERVPFALPAREIHGTS